MHSSVNPLYVFVIFPINISDCFIVFGVEDRITNGTEASKIKPHAVKQMLDV